MKPLLLAVLLGACHKVTYVNPQVPRGGAVHDETGRFFLFGIAGTKNIDAYRMCPTGVARVQSRSSFGDLFLTALTIGLYTPRSYSIECGRQS